MAVESNFLHDNVIFNEFWVLRRTENRLKTMRDFGDGPGDPPEAHAWLQKTPKNLQVLQLKKSFNKREGSRFKNVHNFKISN